MKPTDFSVQVTHFLTHYLAGQRNLSPNTIKAYRDVFTLLLRYGLMDPNYWTASRTRPLTSTDGRRATHR